MVKYLVFSLLISSPALADCRVTNSYGNTAQVYCNDGRSGTFRNGRGELADPFTPFHEAPSARMKSTPFGSTIEVDPPLFSSKRALDTDMGETLKLR